jgi:hypothetical protein
MDEWLAPLRLRLTPEEFRQLPRNPAYKYDYVSGEAHLTPWPRHYHAVLDLPPPPVPDAPKPPHPLLLRPVGEPDLPALERVFAAAFERALPFAGLSAAVRGEAARRSLRRTVSGGDGPWVRQASFLAANPRTGEVNGGLFVTLLPDGDPCETDSYQWAEPPPQDCVARGLGRPHLTWIFVAPLAAAHGTGSALLAASGRALLDLGYRELLSTFVLGNESSMLWHWRSGFRLLPYPASLRRLAERFRTREVDWEGPGVRPEREPRRGGIIG